MITYGITAGDQVVITGLQRAIPGEKVAPQPAPIQPKLSVISRFFIDRPVLANVLAILFVLIGGVALMTVCRSPSIRTWCRRPCR